MSISRKFFEKLKGISENEPLLEIFLKEYMHEGDELSFQTILNRYEKYFGGLINPENKNKLSQHFWEIIDSLKLPLLEIKDDGSAQVYFLYRKQGNYGNDLYVQGDYHGYGSTQDSRKFKRVGDTDVMCCVTPIKKEFANALITYHFVEVSRDKDGKPLIDLNDNKNWMSDPLAKNTKAFEKTESQFCVNAENDMSSWRATDVHKWPTFDEINKDSRLIHLAQKPDGRIVDGLGSFTDDLRSIHVFKPTEKVENVVIVNDGFAYLFCDVVNQVQHFAEKENCAFIFISPHFGLGNIGLGKLGDHELGVRGLEYHINVDLYTAFVLNELLPELNKRGVLPDPRPVNMTVIGASMSGIAALRMGLTHPEQFSRVIAHSPAPIGRDKIDEIPDVREITSRMQIDIECGRFETPEYAYANDNLSYSRELGELFKVKPHYGLHGHQTEAWVTDLKRSLPVVFKQELVKDKKKSFTLFLRDDFSVQTEADKKRKNEYVRSTNKKTTDDSGATYNRPGKK